MRGKRYKSQGGAHLVVGGERGSFVLAWFFPADRWTGATLDNVDLGSPDNGEAEADVCVAIDAARAYFAANGMSLPPDGRPFSFAIEKDARECLRHINAKLIDWAENKPIPEWAQKATAAGWKAPKGWRP